MHTRFRPRDGHLVLVVLTPPQAREVARALRIRLACELDRPFDEPLPSREDAARLRDVLNLCVGQLESLAWREPSRDVRMIAPESLLESIAQDLLTAVKSGWPTRLAGIRQKLRGSVVKAGA